MPIMPCTGQSEARGRTRWCRLATVALTTHTHSRAEEAQRYLDLSARRRGRRAAVSLRLTAAGGCTVKCVTGYLQ